MKLENRKVLVTGGGSGIGLELARRLAETNHVAIAGRSLDKLQIAQKQNPNLWAVPLDVTSEASAENAMARLQEHLGGLDVLVNCAGVMNGGSLTAPDAAWASTEELAVNLGGAVRMTRLALPLLHAAPEAAIVFMSSAVALTAVPYLSVYAATKAGVHSFARSLRAELADTAVRVFEVLPPVVDTDLARGLDVRKIAPSDVANAVIAGMKCDKQQIPVAQVRPLVLLARLAPRVADGIVQRALQVSGEATLRQDEPVH